MNHATLAKRIRTMAKARLVLAIPFVVIGIFLVILLGRNGLLSARGYFAPADVSGSIGKLAEIAGRPLARDLYSVSLPTSSGDIADTGLVDGGDTVPLYHYVAVRLDGHYVLCYMSDSDYETLKYSKRHTFVGTLTEVDAALSAMVIEQMQNSGISTADAKAMLFAYLIDTNGSGVLPRTLLYLLCIGIWAAGLYFMVGGLRPMMSIYNSAGVRGLAQYGPVETIFLQIEQQFSGITIDHTYAMGTKGTIVFLLKDWVVIESTMNMKFIKSSDLLWVYKQKLIKRRFGRGVLSTWVRFSAVLRCRHKTISVAGSKEMVEKLVLAVQKEYPRVVAGFSDKLMAMWHADIGKFESRSDELLAAIRSGKITAADGSGAI